MKIKHLIYLPLIVFFIWHFYASRENTVARFGNGQVAGDYRMYYEAAKGNYEFKISTNAPGFDGAAGFIYPKHTALFWKVFTLMPFEWGWIFWYSILCWSYLFITSKLLEKQYGWIIAVVGAKTVTWSLDYGNVYPVLAALSLNPIGAILATSFKCWIFCFLVLYTVKLGYQEWIKFYYASIRHNNDTPRPYNAYARTHKRKR